jgi:glycosyltransferase involved in cell wall biosynthesis
MASGPPFSTFLPAHLAARRLGLPLVLDFRDDWSGFFNKGFGAREAGRLWRNLVTRLEGRLVRAAALVIGNTPEMCRLLRRLHGGAEDKYAWIPNGFDPDDFRFPPPRPPHDGRLHILYVGTVFQSHPLDDLWQGAALLSAEERRRLAVTIVGRAEADQVLDPGLAGLAVRVIPYRPHREVVRLLGRAHLLMVTLAAIPGLERMVPAKLFEYLAARRPVLALVPRGAASRIVEACRAGTVIPPGRPQELADRLRQWIQEPPPPLGPPPRFFDRRVLTGILARHLDRLSQGG